MGDVFVTPLPASASHLTHSKAKKSRKRIANGRRKGHFESGQSLDEGTEDNVSEKIDDENRAVLGPNARTQRRLAGYPFTEDGPPAPFPHVPLEFNKSSRRDFEAQTTDGGFVDRPATSLRSQHVAAMSALLHTSLLRKDYKRASRALGLLLRTDVAGQPIDIRAGGNWAIAAEILLRRQNDLNPPMDGHLRTDPDHLQTQPIPRPNAGISPKGFEDAKSLYEKLIIQYPYHRSWPGSVNAIDFYIALFNLWVYVAQLEDNTQTGENFDLEEPAPEDSITASTQRELESANTIAARMDTCMRTAPFIDSPELIRLRANVALWQKHLNDELAGISSTEEADDLADGIAANFDSMDLQATTTESYGSEHSNRYREASRLAQEAAQRLFDRIGSSHR